MVLVMSCSDALLNMKAGKALDEKLNLKGYYYSNTAYNSPDLLTIYFLYENGVIYYGGSIREKSLIAADNYIRENLLNSSISSPDKISLGVFNIINDLIQFERWEASTGYKANTVTRKGKILNNYSFLITEKIYHYNNSRESVQDTFYYRPFLPKPDSTNKWVP